MTEPPATSHAASYRPIRHLRRSKGVHKLLYNRLGLPLAASEAAIRSLKYMLNPGQVRLRERMARALPDETGLTDLERRGYVQLVASRLDMLPAMLASCEAAFDISVSNGAIERAQASGPKDFLVSVIRNKEAFRHEGLMQLALSRPLLHLVSRYLGSVPMLSSIRLWWTPPNATATDSQLFHCDREDRRQVKVLINVKETTSETGPFTLIPADASERVKGKLGYSYKDYRLTDEQIRANGADAQSVPLIGPRGSAYCVDTSRCLHYGSRHNSKQRLLLMIQFTRYLAPNVTVPLWLPGTDGRHTELDELQRLVLGVQ